MSIERIARHWLAVVVCVALAACGGGSGFENGGGGGSSSGGGSGGGGGTTPAAVPAALNLVAGDTSASGGLVTVPLTATVTDSQGLAVSNVTVDFSLSPLGSGSISSSSFLTNSSGVVSATLTVLSSAQITVTASVPGTSLTRTTTVTVQSAPNYQIGFIDSSGTFHPGQISVGLSALAAGGSSGLQVSIVDTANGNVPFTGSASVTFTSPCTSQGLAQITNGSGSAGTYSATYVAAGCAGTDAISATATLNNLTATGQITVSPATLGSIRFVSATPTTIGLPGSGIAQASTVVFQVLGGSGQGISNAAVSFSLDNTNGGIALSPATGLSGTNGMVQTVVQSGTVNTSVRVIATATDPITSAVVSTQSSVLTITSGIPDQNSFSLSVSRGNIEGDTVDGNTLVATARLSDHFNNPVPDGTAVSFVTEGGQIVGSCTTISGVCSSTFTTQNPRTRDLAAENTALNLAQGCGSRPVLNKPGCDDHTYTILAYAVGEESYTDTNGNGHYDSGEPFGDLGEPFLDVNDNGTFDSTFETFFDFNNDHVFTPPSGNFTGVLCNSGCDTSRSLYISQRQTVVMSSTVAVVGIANGGGFVTNDQGVTTLTISRGQTVTFLAGVSDTAGKMMAGGTTIAVANATTGLSFSGRTSYSIADSTADGPYNAVFTVTAGSTAVDGRFEIDVTANSGLTTIKTINVVIN